jgi:predicted transposase YdaD
MLGLNELKHTRVYQEARQEEKQETIARMLPLGLTIEQISQSVGMTVEEVQKVIQTSLQTISDISTTSDIFG